jgi:hypothetical protein
MYLHTIVTVCSEYEAPAADMMRNITLSLCIVIRWISYMKCISKVLNKMFTDIPAMRFQIEFKFEFSPCCKCSTVYFG